MKHFIMTFVAVTGLSAVSQAGNLVSAEYIQDSKVVLLKLNNNCQKVEIDIDQGCSRSMPGQASIKIKEAGQADMCFDNKFIIRRVKAADLPCSPIDLTIEEADGTRTRLVVP